jgi:hypothetical protein
MSRKRSIAICLFGAAVCLLAAELLPGQGAVPGTSTAVEALDARVRPFLVAVSQGDTQKAYDDLLRGSPLLVKKSDAVKALVERTSQLPAKFGPYRSFERIDAQAIGKDLVVMKYLYECEDYPVVWYFTFYRPPARSESPAEESAWRAIIVRFDTELERLAK